MQSCVESFRNTFDSAGTGTGGTTTASADSPEAQKLQEQLDEFLRFHTELIAELVDILQEMNECIASNEVIQEDDKKDSKKEGNEGAIEEKIAEENPNAEVEESKDEAITEKEDEEAVKEEKEKDTEEEGKEKDETEVVEGEISENKMEIPDEGTSSAKEADPDPIPETEPMDDISSSPETDLKFKVMEMNSQLKNWARRMESIIERCATLQPQISVFPCMQN